MDKTSIRRYVWAGIVVLVVGVGQSRVVRDAGSDPFEFFAPSVVVSKAERERLKSAAASGGTGGHEAVQQEFRRLVVARVNLYRTGGLSALPPTYDRAKPK